MENKQIVVPQNIKRLLILCIVCLSGHVGAQVTVSEEADITRILELYKNSNMDNPTFRGWRIQIIATNDRSEMEKTIQKFERLYPQIDFKWEHNPPYYQVRIGVYEKKGDLEAFLLELKNEFPSSIPVQDDIKKTELLKD